MAQSSSMLERLREANFRIHLGRGILFFALFSAYVLIPIWHIWGGTALAAIGILLGGWIWRNADPVPCPGCGEKLAAFSQVGKVRFCPNCGAALDSLKTGTQGDKHE